MPRAPRGRKGASDRDTAGVFGSAVGSGTFWGRERIAFHARTEEAAELGACLELPKCYCVIIMRRCHSVSVSFAALLPLLSRFRLPVRRSGPDGLAPLVSTLVQKKKHPLLVFIDVTLTALRM